MFLEVSVFTVPNHLNIFDKFMSINKGNYPNESTIHNKFNGWIL